MHKQNSALQNSSSPSFIYTLHLVIHPVVSLILRFLVLIIFLANDNDDELFLVFFGN